METIIEQHMFDLASLFRGLKNSQQSYRTLVLELAFYKGLSERLLQTVVTVTNHSLNDYATVEKQAVLYRNLIKVAATDTDLQTKLQSSLDYVIEPQYLFDSLTDYAELHRGLKQLTTKYTQFKSLFTVLLKADKEQKAVIVKLLSRLNKIDLTNQSAEKISQDFVKLLDRFVVEDGKRSGYMNTPVSLRRLATKLLMVDQVDQAALTVFDPTMGDGNLIFELTHNAKSTTQFDFYGTEINEFSFKLAKTIAILYGIKPDQVNLQQRDALAQDWPTTGITQFDAVVMQPPFLANWSAAAQFKTDPRFSRYPRLAPKTKADFAFLLHGYAHLKPGGTMVIILPHGVLFRGAAEQEIRKQLILDGSIDTIIGLPANLMTATPIPVIAIVLKKQRVTRDILFIDASHDFAKLRTQNKLTDNNIAKILTAYKQRQTVDKYAYVADLDEIEQNEFNLNIPRYVDTFESEPPVDLAAVADELRTIRREKAVLEQELVSAVDVIDEVRQPAAGWFNELLH